MPREVAIEPSLNRAPRRPGDLREFLLIGAPALGLSLAATTLNAYVPVLAHELTRSRFAVGALVSGEGVVALLFPIWIGAASDRVRSRLGPRLPFMVATAPIAAIALVCAPFMRSIPALVVALAAYYFAYFAYYAPYRALESDLVERAKSGRVNGIQGMFRGAGMGGGLVGGALMFHLWRPLPYLVAAFVLVATTAVATVGLRARAAARKVEAPRRSPGAQVWSLVRERPDIRRFIFANVLWMLTETGLRAFIVLFLTRGLRASFSFAALAMGVVAAGALVAAPLAGKIADRYGPVRVMRVMLAVFGVGLGLATFTKSTTWLLVELPFVGMGGAMALSLPYAILMRTMPRESHGASAGLFDVSSGAGSLLGPLVTGAAIDLLRPQFASTDGYGAMCPVLAAATLLSIPLLKARDERREERDRPEEGLAVDRRAGAV